MWLVSKSELSRGPGSKDSGCVGMGSTSVGQPKQEPTLECGINQVGVDALWDIFKYRTHMG